MNASDLYEYSNKLLYDFSITKEVPFHKAMQTVNKLILGSAIVTYIIVKMLVYIGLIK